MCVHFVDRGWANVCRVGTLACPLNNLKVEETGEEDARRIGLIVVAGMCGSVVSGIILDKFHKFKETTLAVYTLSLVGMVIFTFTLSEGIILVYFTAAFLGSEWTYPESEGTSSGLLNAASQVFGIPFTSIYWVVFHRLHDIWANGIMAAMLLIGTVMTALIKADLRRQAAQSK